MVKEVFQRMAKPVEGNWQKLIRLGRYLKGSPRCVLEYRWQEAGSVPACYIDSNWAGDKTTGKSTTGGIVMLAELVALGKLAMVSLGIRAESGS